MADVRHASTDEQQGVLPSILVAMPTWACAGLLISLDAGWVWMIPVGLGLLAIFGRCPTFRANGDMPGVFDADSFVGKLQWVFASPPGWLLQIREGSQTRSELVWRPGLSGREASRMGRWVNSLLRS